MTIRATTTPVAPQRVVQTFDAPPAARHRPKRNSRRRPPLELLGTFDPAYMPDEMLRLLAPGEIDALTKLAMLREEAAAMVERLLDFLNSTEPDCDLERSDGREMLSGDLFDEAEPDVDREEDDTGVADYDALAEIAL